MGKRRRKRMPSALRRLSLKSWRRITPGGMKEYNGKYGDPALLPELARADKKQVELVEQFQKVKPTETIHVGPRGGERLEIDDPAPPRTRVHIARLKQDDFHQRIDHLNHFIIYKTRWRIVRLFFGAEDWFFVEELRVKWTWELISVKKSVSYPNREKAMRMWRIHDKEGQLCKYPLGSALAEAQEQEETKPSVPEIPPGYLKPIDWRRHRKTKEKKS